MQIKVWKVIFMREREREKERENSMLLACVDTKCNNIFTLLATKNYSVFGVRESYLLKKDEI